MSGFIDGHCHLADPRFSDSIDEVIQRSRHKGVDGWVQGGTWPDDWEKQLELKKRLGRGLITSFGLHPWWVARSNPGEINAQLEVLEQKIQLADSLGETGLDTGPKAGGKMHMDLQEAAFRQQIQIAKKWKKPLVLHVVRAHAAALRELKQFAPFPEGGLMHSFSGTYEEAQGYLSLGFVVSIGSSITRQGFEKLKKAVARIPLDQLVIETDAPDQLPTLPTLKPGQTLNEPALLPEIAAVVGKYRKVDAELLLKQSTENLKRIFKL